ncbi:helix-turn-helix domain-containing protein [Afifella sp. H1R]|uniref:GcrA family cell cycle regulator n=1 Tax=Afifella sp. H1R TaxID=2908841 RepID=UPI001F172615|nr:GcrA family cell cycle regulator [Afifella sp. H1R]MCF1502172.1 helix-turn-helix domain-containing protein [Afifella sp. H1R]
MTAEPTKWVPGRVDRLKQMIRDGMSRDEIARHFGVSRGMIKKVLERHVSPPFDEDRRFVPGTKWTRQQLIDMSNRSLAAMATAHPKHPAAAQIFVAAAAFKQASIEAQVGRERSDSPWTSDRVERLKAMHAAGASAQLIADRLGLSRNSVISKSKRLGLRKRPAA